MEEKSMTLKKYAGILLWIPILAGLYATSLHSYLFFHSLSEIFSVVVAYGIFMVAWNSRRMLDNNYLLFLGSAYFFVGSLDLIHTLAYKGMGIFEGDNANIATQLWIVARYMESLSLLIAPLFIGRRLRTLPAFGCYALITGFLLSAVFQWKIFPACFVEGTGLTPFKKVSEYIISAFLVVSGVLIYRKRKTFEKQIFQMLLASILLTICSELAFTFYISVYGFSNLIGHLFKILSFYLIYKAIIATGLQKPYALLFRNLKQNEEALRESEARYRLLFNGMISGFALHEVVLDRNGRPVDYSFLDVNPAFESLTGLDGSRIIGKKVLEILPNTEPTWIDSYGKVALTGTPIQFEAHSQELGKYFEVFAFCPKTGQFAVTFNDITARKKAEEERERLLQENRGQRMFLEKLMAVIPVGIAVVRGPDHRYEFVNSHYKGISGATGLTFDGSTVNETLPEGVARDAVSFLERVYQAGETVSIREYEAIVGPEQKKTYWNMSFVPLLGEGVVERILIISNEVTDEVVARKQAEELAARDHAILASMNDALIIADPEGNILHMNPAGVALHGFDSTEEAIRHVSEYSRNFELFTLDGDLLPLEYWPLSRVLGGERFSNYQVHVHEIGADRTWYGSYSGTAVYNGEGEFLSAILTIRDITSQKEAEISLREARDALEVRVRERTAELVKANETLEVEVIERKQAEQAVKKSEKLLRAVLDTLPVGVWVIDKEGRITMGNPAGEKIWEGKRSIGLDEHGVDKGWWADTGEPIKTDEWAAARALRKGETSINEVIEIECFDGTRKVILKSAAPIYDANQEIIAAILVNQDISDQKRAEKERELYTKELERKNRELEEFAFVASHDLQEPLRKIQTFSDLVKTHNRDCLTEKAADYFSRIESSAKQMRKLIRALLTYSRVTRQEQTFSRIDLTGLLREVVADLRERIEETNGSVEFLDLAFIEADPSQLRQLFQNLILNALKFHGEKKPVVKVYGKLLKELRPPGKKKGDTWFQIVVEDNGIGFDEKYLNRIFKPFQRLHTQSEYEGTGIGLAICRKIVENHGGTITASSKPGAGAKFIITLPAGSRTLSGRRAGP